jgi:ABC-type oligopeptide transport system substrate-binding subunit/class 3 adenylate cyclase
MEAREGLERDCPLEEARRQVTVLFADLVGFTALSELMDPEEVREIQDAYIEAVTPPIEAYGGSVEKYIGDAVLAVFGVPQAHEDDPERAVRAALEMLAKLSELSKRLEKEHGFKLGMRIGVNTGLVVSRVGEDDFVVTGDTVNLAARLQSTAEPGTILVSQKTHDLSAYGFEMVSLGSVRVKGKAKPVAVYRVLGVKEEIAKPRGLEGLRSRLVGRGAEYKAIWATIERLRSGEGGFVTVLGEAGIGKSRLVAEVRDNLSEGELSWVEGRCLSYGGSFAYLPWLEILRGLMRLEFDTSPDEAVGRLREWVEGHCVEGYGEVYPYVAKMMSLPLEGELEEKLEAMSGSEIRDATRRAMERVLACEAENQPLIIVFEDMHWIDASSLGLLEKLLFLVVKVPILFVLVSRPRGGYGAEELLEMIKGEYQNHHTEIQLAPLSINESQCLVENLMGWEVVPSEIVDVILRKVEGNPFYVEEVLRSLIDQHILVRDVRRGTWEVTQDTIRIAIPDTLQGVLVSRIDRLERETRRVLQIAAVIGRVFQYRVLSLVVKMDGDLDGEIWKLQKEDLIRERPGRAEREFIFKHALTQEATYEGILKKKRWEYHGQVAEALEGVFPEHIEEMLGLLAMHWERSEYEEKAIDYLQRAGDQARTFYAHDEAIDYYQRALAILRDKGDLQVSASTYMKLGLAYHNAMDYQRSCQAYDAGFELWRESGRKEQNILIIASETLRVPLFELTTLDPTLIRYIDEIFYINQLFSGLVELTPELDIVPDIAYRWEILEDGRKYIFHLRDDVYWSDGVPVTAGDFVYSWRKILDPISISDQAYLFFDIKGAKDYHLGELSDFEFVGIRALDDVTLVVELENPTAYFIYIVFPPIPKHVLETHGDRWAEPDHIITNGPFSVESWQPNKLLTLVSNPRYHGRLSGNVSRVEIPQVNDKQTMLDLYKRDEADVIFFKGLESQMLDQARQMFAGEFISAPSIGGTYLVFDTSRPPFDDWRVRRAFALAIDKEKLAGVALRGFHAPATGGLVPPGMPGHSPGIGLPYRPDRASELITQAGYPGGQHFPQVVSLSVHLFKVMVDHIRIEWQESLALDIQWELLNVEEYLDKEASVKPNMIAMAHVASYPDPSEVPFTHSYDIQKGHMALNSKHGVLLRLIDEGRYETNTIKRLKCYRQADKILVENAFMVPLTYAKRQMLIKPWVKRYPTTTTWDDLWKDVIVEPRK